MATTLDHAEETLGAMSESDSAPVRPDLIALDRVIALVLAVGALVVYIRTLCPTIADGDCGEIATAVTTGGVMHPPGYPLYCLIGWVFVHAIPIGEPAGRLGLLSALPAAGAVALAYLISRRLGSNRVWSASASLALAFSYCLWQQATKVETYALNAFFVALLMYLAIAYVQTPSRRQFLILAFCGGLALTNHLTILWLIPAVFAITLPALYRQEGPRSFWRWVTLGACACIAPLILYGYEMVAARTHHGAQVWGDPSTPYRLYLHITGAQYHVYFSKMTAHNILARDFVFVPKFLWRNLGLWLPAAILGLVALYRNGNRRYAVGLLVGVAGYLICNSLYGIPNIYEYYTPVVVIAAVLGAVGMDTVSRRLIDRLRGASPVGWRVAAAVIVAVAAIPLYNNARYCDRSHETFVRSYAENLLRPLPPNAVMLAQGDVPLFSLWYAQDVLGERRDVLIVPSILSATFGSRAQNQFSYWYVEKVAHHDASIDAGRILRLCDENNAYATHGGPLWDVLQVEYSKGRPLFMCGSEQYAEVHPDRITGFSEQAHSGPPLPTLYCVTEGLSQRLMPRSQIPPDSEILARNIAVDKLTVFDLPDLTSVLPDTVGSITDKMVIAKFYVDDLTYEGTLLDNARRFPEAYDRLKMAYALNPWSARTTTPTPSRAT